MRWTAQITTERRIPLIQVTKSAIATLAAWCLGVLFFQTELPIFAAIAALLVVQPSVNQSIGRALERSIGVVAGVTIAFLVGMVAGTNTWIVLCTIVVAIFLAWLLRLTPGSAAQVPVSAMLALAIGTEAENYAAERILETILGAAVGVIVNFAIVPLVLTGPAARSISDLGMSIADRFDGLSRALLSHDPVDLADLLARARALRGTILTVKQALDKADESLRFNPRQSKYRPALAEQVALFERIRPLVTLAAGMTRAVHDHWHPGLYGDPTVVEIARELDRAAHDLRLLMQHAHPAETTESDEPTALTAPLTTPIPDPENWVLIGSLLEDLRRVRESIIGREE